MVILNTPIANEVIEIETQGSTLSCMVFKIDRCDGMIKIITETSYIAYFPFDSNYEDSVYEICLRYEKNIFSKMRD